MGPLPIMTRVPPETIGWLTQPDNPAVAVLTRRDAARRGRTSRERRRCGRGATSTRRSPHPRRAARGRLVGDAAARLPEVRRQPVADRTSSASCGRPGRRARAARRRVRVLAPAAPTARGAATAGPTASIPCLTANVGRALARLGFARDERVVAALAYVRATRYREHRALVDCRQAVAVPAQRLLPHARAEGPAVPRRGAARAVARRRRRSCATRASRAARQGGLPLPACRVTGVPGAHLGDAVGRTRGPSRAVPRRAPAAALRRQAGLAALRLPAVVQLRRARGAVRAGGARASRAARVRARDRGVVAAAADSRCAGRCATASTAR